MTYAESPSSDSHHRKRPRALSPASTMLSQVDPSEVLPPEVFAHVLSFLLPPALARCARVSRTWHEICTDEALWRAFAIRQGYCQLQRQAEETSSGIRVIASVLQRFDDDAAEQRAREDLLHATIERYRSRNCTTYFDGCDSWRTLCLLLWRLDCNWSGSNPAGNTESTTSGSNGGDAESSRTSASDVGCSPALLQPAPEPSVGAEATLSSPAPALLPHIRTLHSGPPDSGVWRCKLDPDEGTYIVTGQAGGIQVFDHDTKKLLWHIAKTATRQYTHLEFSRGWMIFDRQGMDHFEVWRSERLIPDLGRAPDRGHFQRFTVLSSTRAIRAYRFQFPYLCAATQDSHILIWDVSQQKVVETIDFRDSPHSGHNVNYVDFDDDFVFLVGAGAKSVSVFSRRTQRMVWTLGRHFASGAPPPTTWRLEQPDEPSFANYGFVRHQLVRAPPNLWQAGPNTMNMAQLTMTPYQIWSAVHPDPKTKTLLILGQGTVLLIRDYKKFFNKHSGSPDLFIEIEFENMAEFCQRVLERHPHWPATSWNSPAAWEWRTDAQLTVHEGKAFIINEIALILDLDPVSASIHRQDCRAGVHSAARPPRQEEQADRAQAQGGEANHTSSSTLADDVVQGAGFVQDGENDVGTDDTCGEQDTPPILVYVECNLRSQGAHYDPSSVQMDEMGIYYTAQMLPGNLPRDEQISITSVAHQEADHDRFLLQLDFSQRQKLTPRPEVVHSNRSITPNPSADSDADSDGTGEV